MSRLFISHSSKDSFEAIAFRDWLIGEGWSEQDIFLDLHDIGAGVRWKEALAKANERCEAIVLLASPTSLASTECRLEIRMAEDYGKEIIVAILYLLTPDDEELGVYRERHIVDLSLEPRDATFTVEHRGQTKAVSFSRKTLRHIKARLDQLGISPTSFSWRPGNLDEATPYPGFEGFTRHEAGLFFGRAGDIARGLADIRRLRRLGSGQVMVIQAASGAGKSSFLKAGIWPRIERDPELLPVAILRPATGILTGETGLSRQLAAFFSAHRQMRTAADVRQALAGSLDAAADGLIALINEVTEIGHAIQRVARPDAPAPTPVFAVDQAEELFGAADDEESQRFLELIARVLSPERDAKTPAALRLTVPPLFIWTTRADSLDALLHATDKAGLKAPQPFLLPPIPRDAYRQIIEAPLAVANQAGMKISIDPLLVNALVETSSGADALPLLAFTLRQLLAESRSGASARLTLEQFNAAGGMDGILSKRLAAAQRLAGSSPSELRRLFIPHLATWDEDSNPPAAKRLVADEPRLLSGDRTGLRSLADALVEARLLTRSGTERGQPTLEVAHEALLRLSPLSDWLAEDREFLVWRERLGKARAAYEGNTRGLLVGRELQISRSWLDARAEQDDIAPRDRAFIRESVDEEDRRRTEEEAKERQHQAAQLAASRRLARRTMGGLVVALLLALLAGTAGLYAYSQRQDAYLQKDRAVTALAEQSVMMAQASEEQARNGNTASAIALALEALPKDIANPDRPAVPAVFAALNFAIDQDRRVHTLRTTGGSVMYSAYSPDGRRIASVPYDGHVQIWDAATGAMQCDLGGHEGASHAAFSPDGERLAVATKEAKVWDLASCKLLFELKGHQRATAKIRFTPDGKKLVTVGWDNTSRVWDAASGRQLTLMQGPDWSAAASDRDSRWGAGDPIMNAVMSTSHQIYGGMAELAITQDSRFVITAGKYDPHGTPRMWDIESGQQIRTFPGGPVNMGFQFLDLQLSPDGTRLLGASGDGNARIWNVGTADLIATLRGHDGQITSARFSPDGARIVTASADHTARLWDALTGRMIGLLRGHSAMVDEAVFNKDGTLVLTVARDQSGRLWDGQTGNAITVLHGHADMVLHGEFSPDGRDLLTSSRDGSVRIWRSQIGLPIGELRLGEESSLSRQFRDSEKPRLVETSGDGRRAIVSRPGQDNAGWIVNTETGQIVGEVDAGGGQFVAGDHALLTSNMRLLNANNGALLTLLAGSDFKINATRSLILTSDEKALHHYDLANGRRIADMTFDRGALKAFGWVRSDQFVVAVLDDRIEAWDAQSGASKGQIALAGEKADKHEIAGGTGNIALLSKGGQLQLYQAAPPAAVPLEGGADADFEAFRFSDDGRWLAGFGRNGEVRIWATSKGRAVLSYAPADEEDKSDSYVPFGANPGFAELQVGPAKKTSMFDDSQKTNIVQFTDDGFILFGRTGVLWRYANGELTKQKLPLPAKVDVPLAPDCMNAAYTRKLFSLGNVHTLIDVAAGREIGRIGEAARETSVACLSESNQLLTHVPGEENLLLISMLDGQLIRTIATGEPIAGIWRDLSQENEAITLSKSGRLTVWRLADATAIAARDDVAEVLHKDENAVWTLMRDESAVAWKLPGLEKIGELRLPDGEQIQALSFSPDGVGTFATRSSRQFQLSEGPPFTAVPLAPPVIDDKITIQTSPGGKRLVQRGPRPEDLKLIDKKTGGVIKDLNPILPETARAETENDHLGAPGSGAGAQSRYLISGKGDASRDGAVMSGIADVLAKRIDFSPDGKRLMQSLGTGAFRVWDAEDGQELVSRTEPATVDDAAYPAFLGDRLVASLTKAGDLELWNIERRRRIAAISGVAESPVLVGGRPLVAIAGKDGSVRMLDGADGNELWSNLDHQGFAVYWIAAEEEADRLWTLTSDRRLHIRTLAGAAVGSVRLDDAPGSKSTASVGKAYASPDLSAFVFEHEISYGTRSWWIWKEGTNTPRPIPVNWPGNAGSDDGAGWSVNPGGRLVERDPTGPIRLRDGDGGEVVAVLSAGSQRPAPKPFEATEIPQTLVVSSKDGTRIATAGAEGAQLWDGMSGKPLMRLGASDDLLRLDFVADGRVLLAVRADGRIEFRRAADGSMMSVLPGVDAGARADGSRDKESIRRFLSDPHLVLSGKGAVWNVATGQRLLSDVLAVDDAGERILWGVKGEGGYGATKGLEVLNAATGTVIAAIDIPAGPKPLTARRNLDRLRVVDGERGLVVSVDAGAVKVWSLKDGHLVHGFDAREDTVFDFALHPRRREIAIARDSGEVEIWDLDEPRLLAKLNHVQPVISVKYSPDGHRIATLQDSGQLTLWDAESASPIEAAEAGEEPFRFIVFGAAGQRLLAEGKDEARLLDAANGKLVRTFKLADGSPYYSSIDDKAALAFLSDDRWLYRQSEPAGFGVWDAMTGERLGYMREANSSIAPAIAGEGKLLAYATSAKTVALLDLGKADGPRVINGLSGDVSAVAVTPKGDRLAIATDDGKVSLWNALTATKIADLAGRWRSGGLSFINEGAILAVYGTSTSVLLADANTGNELARLAGHGAGVKEIQVSVDGAALFARNEENEWLVWQVPDGARRMKIIVNGFFASDAQLVPSASGLRLVMMEGDKPPKIHAVEEDGTTKPLMKTIAEEEGPVLRSHGSDDALGAAAFLGDGKTVAVGRGNGTVEFYDLETQAMANRSTELRTAIKEIIPLGADRMVTRGEQGPLVLWDTAGRKIIARIGAATAEFELVESSRDGSRLLTTLKRSSSSAPLDPALWETREGRLVNKLNIGKAENIGAVLFTQDNRYFVTGDNNGNVELFEATTGKNVRRLAQHRDRVLALAQDPRTGAVLSTGEDQDVPGRRAGATGDAEHHNIQFRDIDSGRPVVDMRSDAAVSHLRFSPNGELIAIAAVNGVVRIVEAATGSTLIERSGGPQKPESLIFNPDASIVAVGFADGSTRLWRTSLDRFERRPTALELVSFARSR